MRRYRGEGRALAAAYVTDHALGIQLFADAAYYALGSDGSQQSDVVAFLLRGDAERYARDTKGRVATFDEALLVVGAARR